MWLILLMRPVLFLLCLALPLHADELPGHSAHGEAFNEGPRQAAVLIPGCGDAVKFPISTKKPEAQQFFTQGVGQLHGFWYYEAERSFRQVAALDPDCAMAYWGMAMSNVNTEKRAKAFTEKAVKLKDKASAREKQWIGMLETLYKDDKRDKKQRSLDCIRDLENLVQNDPKDIEAKAFLVWRIWFSRTEAPISSNQAVDALLDQIFAASPNHPAHHYRIHLWDQSKPIRALASGAQCGQAAPGIAHMWHMP
ncbi:MAG TPA: alkyl hydroperoxide reductase, partial [Verrucomicrobiales bacterium]|nr:alkyl hydroperoxide reductase [Verrucomicrobiales bacterium]